MDLEGEVSGTARDTKCRKDLELGFIIMKGNLKWVIQKERKRYYFY